MKAARADEEICERRSEILGGPTGGPTVALPHKFTPQQKRPGVERCHWCGTEREVQQ